MGWYAYELRPPGSPPIPPAYLERIKETRPRMEAMAREEYDLEINVGPFGISSRAALIGAKYAETHGVGEAYNVAVLQAYWQEARDIGDTAVLSHIAAAVGLDPDDYLAALAEPQWTEAVLADVEQAVNYGLSGVPALIIADKYLISGARPYPALAQAVEEIGRREGESG